MFKVQIISILEEIDSFYWPKMHLWKGAKKFGPANPAVFSRETVPNISNFGANGDQLFSALETVFKFSWA